MRRNWDVIRKIMVRLEEVATVSGCLESDAVTGVDSEEAFYHMRMLIEAGLAVGSCPEMIGGACHGALSRLTWEGHELLDKIRRDTVWNRVKEIARGKGIDLSADVIKLVAARVIEMML